MLIHTKGKYVNLLKAVSFVDYTEYADRVVATAIGLDPGWASAFGVAFLALLDDFHIVMYRYEVFRRTPLNHVLGMAGAYAMQRADLWGVDPIMFNHSWQTGKTDAQIMIEEGLRPVAVRLPLIQRQSFMLRLWASDTGNPLMQFDTRQAETVALLSDTGNNPESQHCFDATSYAAYALINDKPREPNAPLFIEGD